MWAAAHMHVHMDFIRAEATAGIADCPLFKENKPLTICSFTLSLVFGNGQMVIQILRKANRGKTPANIPLEAVRQVSTQNESKNIRSKRFRYAMSHTKPDAAEASARMRPTFVTYVLL